MIIAAETREAINAHILAEFPKEACGFLIDGKFLPCKNIARDPENNFAISGGDFVFAKEEGTLEAILHSHPNGPAFPSAADMKGQLATNVPWVIVVTDGTTVDDRWVWWGDQLPIAPLIGRPFMHGTSDCYTLIR